MSREFEEQSSQESCKHARSGGRKACREPVAATQLSVASKTQFTRKGGSGVKQTMFESKRGGPSRKRRAAFVFCTLDENRYDERFWNSRKRSSVVGKCPFCYKEAVTVRGLKKHLMGMPEFGGHRKSEFEAGEIAESIFAGRAACYLSPHELHEPLVPNSCTGGSRCLGIGPQQRGEPSWKSRMRWHQSWYRAEVLKVAWGTGPAEDSERQLGSILCLQAGANGLNLLTDEIRKVARHRLTEAKGVVEPYRLWHNMLSSQPMCFNLFGPMVVDLGFATGPGGIDAGGGETRGARADRICPGATLGISE